MGKQRLSSGGYDQLTDDPNDAGLNKRYLEDRRIQLDDQLAKKRRDDELKKHLSAYNDDPIAQTLGMAEFLLNEEKAQKAQRQKEHDDIIKQHDDPVMQTVALAQHYLKKEQAPDAQKAFARQERLDKLQEQDKLEAKLGNAGLGNAVVRESIGSAVQTVPNLASILARVSGDKETADTLQRQSQEFGQAREATRQEDMSPYLSRMYGGASQSLLQMAATPGGAMSKIVGAGAMSGNEALTTAEDAGLTGTDRLRYAGSQALFEAGVAALGQKLFGAGVESRLAGQAVAAETWKQLGKNIGVDALKEMPEEVLTSILQDLSSKYEGVSPDLTLGDFVQNSVDAAVQSAMMAAMGNAPNAGRIMLRGQPSPPIEPGEKLLNPDVSESAPAVTPEPATEAASPVVEQAPEPQPIAPAIEAFLNDPRSATKYEQAVKAGLPAIDKPNREPT